MGIPSKNFVKRGFGNFELSVLKKFLSFDKKFLSFGDFLVKKWQFLTKIADFLKNFPKNAVFIEI